MDIKDMILQNKTALGIELGSTRIKAVLSGYDGEVIAKGIYDWENSFVNGIWTYSLDEVKKGIKFAYKDLKDDIYKNHNIVLKNIGAIGISAMMHGYIALDSNYQLLSLFQTWRNTNTKEAASQLTDLFKFNIPLRWSIAHLYQRVLDQEEHIHKISHLCTLSTYVHFLLTGEMVVGIGDASGMFPISHDSQDYNREFIDLLNIKLREHGCKINVRDILPRILLASEYAGKLSADGAIMLDEAGDLQKDIPFCAPEGDAGTGMVATNSISANTGNFSAGTSMFATVVLDKPLSKYYKEIDILSTPDGLPAVMSHANNGTSDLNAWVDLFHEFSVLSGNEIAKEKLYDMLYNYSLNADSDCGDLISYGYLSGEAITGLDMGSPMIIRKSDSIFSLSNLMRANLYSSLAVVRLGFDLLKDEKDFKILNMVGHGGFFKSGISGDYLAASLNTKVTVMDTASEGGAWGMSILALFMLRKNEYKGIAEFLDEVIFKNVDCKIYFPDSKLVNSFDIYLDNYKKCLPVEQAAVKHIYDI